MHTIAHVHSSHCAYINYTTTPRYTTLPFLSSQLFEIGPTSLRNCTAIFCERKKIRNGLRDNCTFENGLVVCED